MGMRTVLALAVLALVVGALLAASMEERPRTHAPTDAGLTPTSAPRPAPRAARKAEETARTEAAATQAETDRRATPPAGALEMKRRIEEALAEGTPSGVNRARLLFVELGSLYKDETVRAEIGYDALGRLVDETRDALFRKEVPRGVFRAVDALIEKALRDAPEFNPSVAPKAPGLPEPGTLAAARQWTDQELTPALWSAARTELGLANDEMEKYWMTREVTAEREARYGSGSFLVVKWKPKQRPIPSAGRLTDEQWWSGADATQRAAWLGARFVESSGYFQVVRAENARCPRCGGDGAIGDKICRTCNGCGVERVVVYR